MFVQKDWLIKESAVVGQGAPAKQGLSLAEQILANRGMTSRAEIEAFFNPSFSQMHDPFLFPDMDKACRIIQDHHKRNGAILIYGDYDVDGLTATALLVRGFKRLGIECNWMIPDRLLDGYGLSQSSLPRLLESAPDLVITVDCGIASYMEIDQLNQAGIEVIVTDHHECQETLPPAMAIINPKIPNCPYPFNGLSGAGVALKLLQALSAKRNNPDCWQFELVLAALGTVADVVPVTNENRFLVKAGLEKINSGSSDVPCGIRALLDSCQKNGDITASTLGFTLGPRLNAAGRMGVVAPAMQLLLGTDPEEARLSAESLNELNRQRQQLEARIMEEAIAWIDQQGSLAAMPILIAAGRDWHPGVIGIVCSRLVERYTRPVIMLAGDENDRLRGSCRTCGDVDILKVLQAASDHTITFGGHKKAAGVELTWQQLPAFREAVGQYARSTLADHDKRPVLYADMTLDSDQLTLEHAQSLSQLEPFGEENPQPMFIAYEFTITQWRLVGNGRHVKLRVSDNKGASYDAIAFGMSEADELFHAGDMVDMLFSLEINCWRNMETLQLQIRDLRHSASGQEFHDKPWLADELYLDNHSIRELSGRFEQPVAGLVPEREDFKIVYQYLKARFGSQSMEFDLSILARRIASNYHSDISAFKLSRILQVFDESGLLTLERLEYGRCRVTVRDVTERVRLETAPAYRRIQAERESE